MRFEFYENALRWLTQHRWLWEIVMTTGTWFTLFVEIGFPFLVWYRRCRWPMLAAALTLHLGIGLLMGLMTFSLAFLTLLLAFVPAEAVEEAVTRALAKIDLETTAREELRAGALLRDVFKRHNVL